MSDSAGPYQQLLEQYRSAKNVDEKITVLSSSDLLRKDSSLTDLVTEFGDKPSAKLQTEIQDQLQLRAETEAGIEGKVLSPSAKEITDSPLYSHPQTKEQKNNWLGDALSKIHINFPHFQAPENFRTWRARAKRSNRVRVGFAGRSSPGISLLCNSLLQLF